MLPFSPHTLSSRFTLAGSSARRLRFDVENGVLGVLRAFAPDAQRKLGAVLEACAVVSLGESEWARATKASTPGEMRVAIETSGRPITHLDDATLRKLLALRIDLRFKAAE